MAKDDIPLFPSAGYEVRPIPAYGAIFIRIPFSPHAMADKPDPGRRYLFYSDQARQLAEGILAALHDLATGGKPGDGMPKH